MYIKAPEDKGKVSIVVPVYNQEKFLDTSLPSILKQSYKDIEIVVVNDGSTDGSLKILNDYRNNDNRIVIVNKSNGGLVDAVACGIEKATGDWIAFVDPDDFVEPEFISCLIALADEDTDIVAGGINVIEYENENDTHKKITLKDNHIYIEDDLLNLRKDFFWDKERGVKKNTIFQSRWNKIYRSEIVKKIVGDYSCNKSISMGEDSIFTYLVLQESKKVISQKESVGYNYCLRRNISMTRSSDYGSLYKKYVHTYKHYRALLEKNGDSYELADELLYTQIMFLLGEASKNYKDYKLLHKQLKADPLYKNILVNVKNNSIMPYRLKLELKNIMEINMPTIIPYVIRSIIF